MWQENVGFEAIYSLRYEQGSRISTAGCAMRKTDQDISNYSVLKSITLTRGYASLKKVYTSMVSHRYQPKEIIFDLISAFYHFFHIYIF